jgi:hypothetical protein
MGIDLKKITPFDQTEIFELELKPLLSNIEVICAKNGVPFFYEFAVKNDSEGTRYERGILAPKGIGLTLKENTVLAHNLVAAGFKPVPPSEIQEFDMDSIKDMSSSLDD